MARRISRLSALLSEMRQSLSGGGFTVSLPMKSVLIAQRCGKLRRKTAILHRSYVVDEMKCHRVDDDARHREINKICH